MTNETGANDSEREDSLPELEKPGFRPFAVTPDLLDIIS